ncbi:similar to Saccharomyces cerevisiae YDR196C CAB5 Probable dephospho-CoA kinase (DPCK) that catalyzes the last step in coenzyme A biosynthesis [Maudiozyma barnettii]|uniref:Similar to Saccharomyces cerevisiae YDR196C CAB5 Probable dephospho-CoA kinase (DPCK) that catalyzes the last step in coenzyme A biosynthesis n=1 Tax=Maudiozyma barnettii TaxID=61262 RepID=A0A8H2VGY4_9SACH|nr:putative dephospho-CoA kinase [Kazachstania barnettii]CAB4254999.1 similar to Saccharomyces cerevisiae YDR196C CAB5 Probable dephospho-CoA kinase (DPCK) that catalyzes the last step in coenzyme A biosynthesis [Kazachstania barnettii]CAD1783270.1 similar to Saccharomyces cerevisiae YDR196C CAB5 Probable dephospho-CoA kinase (DPCK) that catalyzes the last step in coenzyme A biosynthesis [Kazachstania barnettii]
MLIIGLTGGIACGKSTVSRRFKDKYKIPIVDADKISRDVVEPGTKVYQGIVNHFKGKISELLMDDGHLNRQMLGKYVFSHPEDLKVLNDLTHPAIRYAMLREVLGYYIRGYSMCVLDVPLLFEGGLDSFCGVTISVVCENETQLERLQVRDITLSIEDARNRIKSQMPMEQRVEVSDYVLENDKSVVYLYQEIDTLMKKIKPTALRAMLEYFPPFGVVSASAIVAAKYIHGKPRYIKKIS